MQHSGIISSNTIKTRVSVSETIKQNKLYLILIGVWYLIKIISKQKLYKKYWRKNTISAPTLIRGGNSECLYNRWWEKNLVSKY